MFYDRKIEYFDYLENGDKVRNAGFVKIEVVEEFCNIQVNINGLFPTDTFTREVSIWDGSREAVLGEIELKNGRGSVQWRKLMKSSLGKEGLPYEQVCGFRIYIAKNRELLCKLRAATAEYGNQDSSAAPADGPITYHNGTESFNAENEIRQDAGKTVPANMTEAVRVASSAGMEEDAGEAEHTNPATPAGPLESADAENTVITTGPPSSVETANLMPPTETPVNVDMTNSAGKAETADMEEAPGAADSVDASETSGITFPQDASALPANAAVLSTAEETCAPHRLQQKAAQSNPGVPVRLFDNKWKQLSSIYPHLAPFRDERDYLSIGPADFVVLRREYHKLVNNSFLLHGYYNYEHLILTRVEQRGEERYYVGVPGNFYEREKQVAVMYGFESFECKTEPAETGDYGYYMIRVEI